VTRQCRRYAVQKEGSALKALALFVKENLHEMAHGLIFKPVTLPQFDSRLTAIVQSLLEDFIP
jgi:hypothetical protein